MAVALLLALLCKDALGQAYMARICVQDQSGRAVVGARIQVVGDVGQATESDGFGCANFKADVTSASRVLITSKGFQASVVQIGVSSHMDVVLVPNAVSQVVEVTAARVPLPVDATASSVLWLSQQKMDEAAGLSLDDALRQVAGFQLFRRTSSWVANPTTQGTSLHGLGSTAASRTLVMSDQVPLNDAFGGWIHWDESPKLAVAAVELMRGGASDLYGSSAIGGVIDVIPVLPKRRSYVLDVAGASHTTTDLNGLVTESTRHDDVLAALSLFRTDGYILIDPAVRGPIDTPYNVHSQAGRVEWHHVLGVGADIFLRGNLLNEARNNGTRVQTNGTRLWRYVAGGDLALPASGRLRVRFYGDNQSYRQSFSAISVDRSSERLTRLQRVPSQQVGGSLQLSVSHRTLTFVAGGDLTDTRATDDETPIVSGAAQPIQSTSARQRQGGIYGEVLWQPMNWSIAFSSRFDRFHSFDAHQVIGIATPISMPATDEYVFDPRLGVVRKIGSGISLTAAVFRAFRGPTMNELYRTGQVGQQITKANPSLLSERATGWEAGTLFTGDRTGSLRASYFWTQVNRPIAATTLSSTATTLLEMRENLGQLTSKGTAVEGEWKASTWLQLDAGYQYADSTITKFQSDPLLVGKWTAQVPRNSATAQLRMERSRLGVLRLDLRTSGQQFDDSANQYRLAGYAQIDLYADHRVSQHLRIYTSVQNLGGNRLEAGRTPVLTLGVPRTALIGLRIR